MRFRNFLEPSSCTFLFRRQQLILPLLGVILAGVFSAAPLLASVNSGEIIASSVSATVSNTFDPVNGYSVRFRWTTVHPGNSIVVIEDPDDYRANNNYSNRQIVQDDNVTNHTVIVDHFPAYSYSATWGYRLRRFVSYLHDAHCPHQPQRPARIYSVAGRRFERLSGRSRGDAILYPHREKLAGMQ